MFAGWGSRVARLRWPVLIIALVAVIGSGIWGFGVFGQLTEGGYNDPRSESARAADVAATATGGQGGDVIAIYTPDQGTIDDAALTKRIKERLAALPESAVESQTSYWDKKAPAYAAENKSSAVAVITLAGEDDAAKMEAYADIEPALAVPGAHVQLAGGIPLAHASSQRSTDDLAFAELVSLPIVLILLLLIFGSLVAASLPVLVGGAAVLGSLGVLHAVALTHEVNSFAVNVASLLGLGMAIDYGLFMVGRFREEQAVHDTSEAVRRTVATAGRTVVFSATLLMTALAGLLLFPQGFLKSLAYGGLAAVFLAMMLSLTLLPALLAVLGPRVDLIPIRLPGRASTGGWERLAGWVLRRPVLVAVPILGVLLLLAAPIADARFGENDERQLPAGDPSRVAIETLKTDYPQFSSDGVQIVVRSANGEKPDVKDLSAAAAKVTGVETITTTGAGKDTVILTADLQSTDTFSDEARDAVDGLRALTPPAGTEVLIGGTTARNVDSLEAIGAELPLMIGLLAGATLVLMFLAFGSILLPIKAVVMSALSLTATFGSLVWIFQEGHGASWLDVTPTPLEAGIVVLMAAVVFGLSTDYEVFLLSRMVEARLRGASTHEAVTVGLARTGRVISAAALLLIVVTGAFALSSISTMRFIGVGMIIALVLDATVVRVLLVPAVLAILGDASWWAPGPLRRLQEKAGLAEYAGEEEPTGRHAWRPIDPSFEETAVLDGTLLARALPAAPAQAALTSGSDTVVLDYDAFLKYLSEKDEAVVRAGGLLSLPSGTPSGDPSPAGVSGPGRHRDADEEPDSASPADLSSELSSDVSSASAASAAASPPDSDSSADSPPLPSSPSASSDSSSPLASSSESSDLDEREPDASPSDNGDEDVNPDSLWAEVDATLAAGAELTKPDAEPSLLEAYTEAHSADSLDPAATHVLRLPTSVSPASPESDPAATQVIKLPGAEDSSSEVSPVAADGSVSTETEAADSADGSGRSASWSDEPTIFSATVYNGLFTDETVRAATPDPEPEPEEPEATTSDDDFYQFPDDSGVSAIAGQEAEPEPAESEPLTVETADPVDAEAPDPVNVEPADPVTSETVEPLDSEPQSFEGHSFETAEPVPVEADDLESADAESAGLETTDSAGDDSGSEDSEFGSAGHTRADLSSYLKPADSSPAEPVTDPFSWRSDPRLANLTAPEPDTFPWLDRYAALPGTPQPTPEAALPHPAIDQPDTQRPQNLDDWMASAPTPPRSRSARPETLGDLPAPVSRNRPDSLADLPSRKDTADAPAVVPAEADEPPTFETDEPAVSELADPDAPAYLAEHPDLSPQDDQLITLATTEIPETVAAEHDQLIETEFVAPGAFDELSEPATDAELSESPTDAADVSEPAQAYFTEPEPEPLLDAAPETVFDPTETLPEPTETEPAETASELDETIPESADPTSETVETDAVEAEAAETETEAAEAAADPADPADPADDIVATSEDPEVAEESTLSEPVTTFSELTETFVEPAADQPTEIADLEPAEAASIDELTDLPATDEPTEPVEVDAWRDPAVLAQSAVGSTIPSMTPADEADGIEPDDTEADRTEADRTEADRIDEIGVADEDDATPEGAEPGDASLEPTALKPADLQDIDLEDIDLEDIGREASDQAEFDLSLPVASPLAATTEDDPEPIPPSTPDAIEDPVDDEITEEPAPPADEAALPEPAVAAAVPPAPVPPAPVPPAPVSPAPEPFRRPQTLDEWLSSPVPLHRPQTLEDLPVPAAQAGPNTLGDVNAAQPETDRNEADFPRGRRPETLDDRLRGTVRPSTLADHLPEHGRGARRPANTGPSWTGGSGEHPYDRQTRRPASLADHPGPARGNPDEEPGPDQAR